MFTKYDEPHDVHTLHSIRFITLFILLQYFKYPLTDCQVRVTMCASCDECTYIHTCHKVKRGGTANYLYVDDSEISYLNRKPRYRLHEQLLH